MTEKQNFYFKFSLDENSNQIQLNLISLPRMSKKVKLEQMYSIDSVLFLNNPN